MKVAWFHKFGGPEVLLSEEAPKPAPKPGEALIRVRAVGINHVDLDHRAGTSRIPVKFPHILGREFAGEIAALNGEAPGFKEGDRVWITCRIPCRKCEFCLAGRDNLCVQEGYFGLDIPGGYAEYVCVPILNLNALPAQMSFENAAAAQIAFGTAWHVLITRGGIIVTVGAHAGEVVEFDIIPFFRKELRLAGSKNAPVLELRKVMGLVADGKLNPIIHKAFPLAQAAEAHRVVDSRDFFGKVILVP